VLGVALDDQLPDGLLDLTGVVSFAVQTASDRAPGIASGLHDPGGGLGPLAAGGYSSTGWSPSPTPAGSGR
jgi:hypothetical protein